MIPFSGLLLRRAWAKTAALLLPIVRRRLAYWQAQGRAAIAREGESALWFEPQLVLDLSLVENIYEFNNIRHLEPLALQKALMELELTPQRERDVMLSVRYYPIVTCLTLLRFANSFRLTVAIDCAPRCGESGSRRRATRSSALAG